MLELLAGFALTSLLIELTPGPNMAYLAVLSLDRGRRYGMSAVAGVAAGLLVLGLAAGFGAGTLVAETRWLYEILRWAGVLYLLYLAWESYRDAQRPVESSAPAGSLAGYFGRGLLTNVLNPKAAIFYITVMPNFIDPARPPAPQALTLTLIYVAVATAVHAAIVAMAGTFQPLLAESKVRRRMGILFAAVMVGIAAWLAVSTRQI